MSLHKRGPKSPEMNMTPLIDVTFQLIIFFMLVNNIISEETVELKVPKLHDPKVKEFGEARRVVVNVVPPSDANPTDRFDKKDGWLKVNGAAEFVRVGQTQYIIGEQDEAITADLKASVEANEEVQVMLRADAATFYENMQPVMAAITKAGIKTVNLVAFMPDQGPDVDVNDASDSRSR